MKEISLDAILKSYLTIETMRINNPDYTYNMVIAAMKHACYEVLDLAAENADYLVISEPGSEGIVYKVDVNKNSILQIKDWIK